MGIGIRMIFKHSLSYFLSKVIPGFIEILAIAIYTRLLGESEYGLYALVLGGVLLLDMSLFSWIRLSLVRFWPKYEEKELLSTLIVLFSVIALITVLGGLSITVFLGYSEHLGIVLSALFLLWSKSWFELHLDTERSRLEPYRYRILTIVRSVISVFLGGMFAYMNYGAVGILTGMAAGTLITFFFFGRKRWGGVSFRLAGGIPLKPLLQYGIPFTLSLSIGFLVNSADRYMIAMIESVESSGLYAAGYDLPGKILSMIFVSLSLAATPLVMRSYEHEGTERTTKLLRKYFSLSCSILVPSCIGIIILTENIATVLLGQQFREAAIDLLPLIAIGTLLAGTKSYYVDLSFQLANRTRVQVWIAVIAFGVNIGLNIWWIPKFGIIGAAYSTIATFIVSVGISWMMSRRIFKLPIVWLTLVKVLFAAAGMVIVLFPFLHFRGGAMLIVQIVIGTCAYGLFYLVLNIENSRQKIKRLIFSE
jgi:O-antigen/teichoic acid export membrane protein